MPTLEAPGIEVVDLSPTLRRVSLLGDDTLPALYERRHSGERQSLTWPTQLDSTEVAFHMLPAIGGALRLTICPRRPSLIHINRAIEDYGQMLRRFRGDDGMRFGNEEFMLETDMPNAGDGTLGFVPGSSDKPANVQVCFPVLEHPFIKGLFEQTATDNFRPLFDTILTQLQQSSQG